jgi:hypothetical protein
MTDKNFKLSKRAKTMIALLCTSDSARSNLKSALVVAEDAAATARKQSLKSKGKKPTDM